MNTSQTSDKAMMIRMSKIYKSFGHLVALNNVDFSVRLGEIHGLLGENGAGKSTLMNILYGLYRADRGELYISEEEVTLSSPADSIKYGVGMVHQASTLVPSYTAVENIVIGASERRLDFDKSRRRIEAICENFGFNFPFHTKVELLSVGIRQKIEIVRSLYRNARILILDEPTTSLVESEFEQLRESLRTLAASGITCVFITHKIREVLDTCDRATVLRKGNLEGTVEIAATTKEQLVSMMFIEKNIAITDSALPVVTTQPMQRSQSPVCELNGVSVGGQEKSAGLRGVSLSIYSGEILGIAGVSGSGQKELAKALIDPLAIEEGDILLKGQSIRELNTLQVFKLGIAYTPEDRIKEAILPDGNLTQNVLLPHFSERQFSIRGVFTNWSKAMEKTKEVINAFDVVALNEKTICRKLSGGNIQKVVLGRALLNPVEILVVDNPCSGLDIATVELILNKLVNLRDSGKAVLWINEDLDELMLCCDRIGVMYNGELVDVVGKRDFDKYTIGYLMTGGRMPGER
jgi:simple sugar transport system ATP-binding protein